MAVAIRRYPINSVQALPTGQPDAGLRRTLGQVLDKGRNFPAGLYPITTRNDVEEQVGYVGPDTGTWPITGPLTEQQNTGITDSRDLTNVTSAGKVLAGSIPLVDQSGKPTRVGKYDWAIDTRGDGAGLVLHRPKGEMAPYVRSWLDDETRRAAVDLNIRGNMAYNEWERNLPHVYEQGNGFALAGPAYASSSGNVDTF